MAQRGGWPLALLAACAVWSPSAHGAPEIVSLAAEGSLSPGGSVTIAVIARDSERSVNSFSVRFPGDEGVFAESACALERTGAPSTAGPFEPGRAVRVKIPYPPATPGVRLLDVVVGSGGCDGRVQTVKRALAINITLPKIPFLPLALHAGVARSGRTAQDCPNADTHPTAANAPLMRAATLCLMNIERSSRGLRLLHTDRRLRTAALRHSRDMLRRRYMAHSGPDGPSLVDRLSRVRYWPATSAENLGQGMGALATPRAMVAGWMGSDGHRANILLPGFRQVGIGVLPGTSRSRYGATYTVNFGRR